MARIESLSQLLTTDGKDLLAEVYGKVIDNVQKETISERLKNTDLSGTPTAGSVECKRFTNTESKAYGTARAGGAGQKNEVKPVTLKIDTDRELIHEVEQKDISLYGVEGLISRKAAADTSSMKRELERSFFETAVLGGTQKETFTATDALGKFEEIVQLIETTQNEFVDGVPRDMISVIMNPATYGELRTFIDTKTYNANVETSAESINTIHGVEVYSSTYMPSGVKMIAMCKGSVGRMVLTNLDQADKFPASNAYHFGLFYSYGNVAVTPDLIYYVADGATNLKLSAKDSETSSSTDISVNYVGVDNIKDYYYKDNTSTALAIGTSISGAGYTKGTVKDGVMTVASTNGNKIAVVAVNAEDKVVAGNVVTAVIS